MTGLQLHDKITGSDVSSPCQGLHCACLATPSCRSGHLLTCAWPTVYLGRQQQDQSKERFNPHPLTCAIHTSRQLVEQEHSQVVMPTWARSSPIKLTDYNTLRKNAGRPESIPSRRSTAVVACARNRFGTSMHMSSLLKFSCINGLFWLHVGNSKLLPAWVVL